MRRTSIPLLITIAVLSGGVGWLGEIALVASGSPTLVPPLTLCIALFGIAAIVVALGWPIRQWVRGKRTTRVDPFAAMRVLALAKACSLTGAILSGALAGVLIYALSRAVLPAASSLTATIVSLSSALVVTAAGLIVEHWCKIPPSADTEVQPAQTPARN